MSSNVRGQRRIGRRRGNMLLEALLILPIGMVLVCALVEFALVISANQRLSAASASGARVASQGGGKDDVERAVKQSLGNGPMSQARVEIVGEKGQRRPRSGETVEVIVHIQAGEVVPDLLAFVGLSLKDETLVGRTAQRVE